MAQGVYKISVEGTSKVYVGSSVDLEKRFKRHLSRCRAHKHCNPILQACFDKYGEESFIFSVTEYVDNAEFLEEREQHWIDRLASEGEVVNLCLVAGSRLGSVQSGLTRSKISNSLVGKPRPYMVERNRVKNPSRVAEPPVREKISLRAKERYQDKTTHPMYGKTQTEEHRKANSLSHVGLQRGSKHPRATITEEQAVEIKRLLSFGQSAAQIARDIGCSYTVVDNIKRGKAWVYLSF